MVMYHCNMNVGAVLHEIFSFNLVNMARLISSRWLPIDIPCLPGAFI